ncbi:MAG: hypothetical protein ACKO1K_11310 [Burkholderiales bacterium]
MNFRNVILVATIGVMGATLCSPVKAVCDASQLIRLSVSGAQIDDWSGTSDRVRSVTLPNGFKLGVKIEEASREMYAKWTQRTSATTHPEMVRISLYDLTEAVPRLITRTWGGANSKQGYGPKGGADRVDEVGNPGILFTLSKPSCSDSREPVQLTAEMIAQKPTAAMLNQVDEKPQPSADNLRGKAAALADVQAGIYRVVYPDNVLSNDEMGVLKREVEKIGLQLTLESQLNGNGAYSKGYATAMMGTITDKVGHQKMREMELSIKKGMAELKAPAK